jgi:hypothetical protein
LPVLHIPLHPPPLATLPIRLIRISIAKHHCAFEAGRYVSQDWTEEDDRYPAANVVDEFPSGDSELSRKEEPAEKEEKSWRSRRKARRGEEKKPYTLAPPHSGSKTHSTAQRDTLQDLENWPEQGRSVYRIP